MTDCNFRAVPQNRYDDEDMAGEVQYLVDKRDMFPEQWGPFLLGDDRIRAAFMKYHADLLTPEFWNARKKRIQAGYLEDVFPYPTERRFRRRYGPQSATEQGRTP